MNIFYLDENPSVAARFHNDVHARKMITETAQVLSNCYSENQLYNAPKTQKVTVRKYSYPHHPCCKWAKETLENFQYVVDLGLSLIEEVLYRGFNKHFSSDFIVWCQNNHPDLVLKEGFQPPALAMPEHFHSQNSVESYRNYYRQDKVFMNNGKRMDFWTKRGAPYWW